MKCVRNNKKINSYKQKGDTCAICCMLMVLEYYNIIPKANYLYEKKYYRSYRSKYLPGVPLSAILWHLSKNGLEVELIHSHKNYFFNNDYLPSDIFSLSLNEYKEYVEISKKQGAKISYCTQFDSEMLQKLLKEDKLIIVAGMVNDVLHTVLISDYIDNSFVVYDPLYKEKQLRTCEEMEKFINTPIGKWCITVKK